MMQRIPERKSFFWRTLVFDIAFAIFGILSLARFWKKSRQAADRGRLIRERLGWVRPLCEGLPTEQAALGEAPSGKLVSKPVIWIHAVSVGEVQAIRKFVERLLENFTSPSIIISTVTPTGQSVAEPLRARGCSLIYFPFDLSFIAGRVLDRIRPDLILLAETEIWPNFILQAKKRGIPVGLVNGRISEKSLAGYRKVLGLFRPVFDGLDFCLVQTPADARRFGELGIEPSRIQVLGNMKFDQTELGVSDPDIRARLGFSPGELVLVAGSTHPGEEEMVLKVVKDLKGEFFNLRLLLAPRHPERASDVEKEARKFGFSPGEVLIVDRIGQLARLYAAADLVVMGGSFIPHGGQNPIEPALAARAVLSGPNVSNFRSVYEMLAAGGGARIVADESALLSSVRELLKDEAARGTMGENAKRIVLAERGATERHVEWVGRLVSKIRNPKHEIRNNFK